MTEVMEKVKKRDSRMMRPVAKLAETIRAMNLVSERRKDFTGFCIHLIIEAVFGGSIDSEGGKKRMAEKGLFFRKKKMFQVAGPSDAGVAQKASKLKDFLNEDERSRVCDIAIEAERRLKKTPGWTCDDVEDMILSVCDEIAAKQGVPAKTVSSLDWEELITGKKGVKRNPNLIWCPETRRCKVSSTFSLKGAFKRGCLPVGSLISCLGEIVEIVGSGWGRGRLSMLKQQMLTMTGKPGFLSDSPCILATILRKSDDAELKVKRGDRFVAFTPSLVRGFDDFVVLKVGDGVESDEALAMLNSGFVRIPDTEMVGEKRRLYVSRGPAPNVTSPAYFLDIKFKKIDLGEPKTFWEVCEEFRQRYAASLEPVSSSSASEPVGGLEPIEAKGNQGIQEVQLELPLDVPAVVVVKKRKSRSHVDLKLMGFADIDGIDGKAACDELALSSKALSECKDEISNIENSIEASRKQLANRYAFHQSLIERVKALTGKIS